MTVFDSTTLQGRVALVTGGGSGIGKGIAAAFLQHGAKVTVLSRSQERLDQAAHELDPSGERIFACAADVRRPPEVQDAMRRAVEHFGGLDILVNGAAGNFLAPAATLSEKGFRTVIEIDLEGTFNVSKAAFAALQTSSHARVINISATLQARGTPLQSHAAAAKAGIDALTRSLAVEWGPLGIRVNALAPGPVADTEGMARLAPGDVRRRLEAIIPLGRFGRIDEIAQAAVFLASDAASYITGTVLVVDGGDSVAAPALFGEGAD